jgi:hypothetical protein
MASKGRSVSADPPTLAAILERLENTRRLVQLSVHHVEQALTEAGEAVSALKELEAEIDLLARAGAR